ncbi:MAG TPA: DUF3016 domain-containing protein [Opitutaceae bacterium]|nr:DUF3016 domain-containing protein [Opitutaceae bacterium]
MKSILFSLFVGLVLLSGCATMPQSTAKVEVNFENPDKFTDFKTSYMGTDRDIADLTNQFTKYLQNLGGIYLPDGDVLTITFTDIDLAGDFEPWHGPQAQDIRFLKEIYPPRLTFNYKLTDASGKVVAEGSKRLMDLNYQMRIQLPSTDPLRYEKSMLDDWMRGEIKPQVRLASK